MEREREQGSDRLDTEERKELNDSDFGLPEERKYPMPDATHVRAAESYFRYATDQQKPELALIHQYNRMCLVAHTVIAGYLRTCKKRFVKDLRTGSS